LPVSVAPQGIPLISRILKGKPSGLEEESLLWVYQLRILRGDAEEERVKSIDIV
jgi:hypothetical protein